jgi:phosphatidylglycerophosphate synthase
MQANKIWKSVLILLIPVLIGLSWFACHMAESEGAAKIGGVPDYYTAFTMVFLGAIVGGFVAFLYSLPVILMIAMIYRLFKGLD